MKIHFLMEIVFAGEKKKCKKNRFDLRKFQIRTRRLPLSSKMVFLVEYVQ